MIRLEVGASTPRDVRRALALSCGPTYLFSSRLDHLLTRRSANLSYSLQCLGRKMVSGHCQCASIRNCESRKTQLDCERKGVNPMRICLSNDTNCHLERWPVSNKANGLRFIDCDVGLNDNILKNYEKPVDESKLDEALTISEKRSNPTCTPKVWTLSIPLYEECENLYAEILTKQLHKPESWHLKGASNTADARGETIAIEIPTLHTHHPFFFFPLCASERRYSG